MCHDTEYTTESYSTNTTFISCLHINFDTESNNLVFDVITECVSYGGSCYFVGGGARTRYSASHFCNCFIGGHLAELTSLEKHNFLIEYIYAIGMV